MPTHRVRTRLAPTFQALTLSLPLLFAAGCGGAKNAEAPAKAPAVTTSSRRDAGSAGRCAVRVSPDKKLTEIISQHDGYGVLLPGGTWDVQCDEKLILFASSDLRLSVSIEQGDSQGPTDPEQYLRIVYDKAAALLKAHGWEAGAPRVAEVSSPSSPSYRRVALFHEVLGVQADGQPMKSIHAWTMMRTKQSNPLDYHVAWTGPESDWQEPMLDGLGVMLLSFGPLENPEERQTRGGP